MRSVVDASSKAIAPDQIPHPGALQSSASRSMAALSTAHHGGHDLPAAADLQPPGALRRRREAFELARTGDLLTVDLDHHVARAQAEDRGRRAVVDRGNDHALQITVEAH